MTEAERITQEVADRRFNRTGEAGSTYRVELPGIPAAVIVADSGVQAIERYDDLCGITGIDRVKHHVTLLEEYPHPMPAE